MNRDPFSDDASAPRDRCAECRRPTQLCYCAHVTPIRTRTRVVILQHPREAKVSLGTLRMVELGLPEAVVRRGVEFSGDPLVEDLYAQQPAPYVLFPGPGARELSELAAGPPVTLVVIDGTWSQAKQLLRRNPRLAALPRVAFTPGAPSAYRIRRQPAEHCVSTVEALARALDVLEGAPGELEPSLLQPLHALVADQLRIGGEQQAYRVRRPRRRATRPPPLDSAERLRASAERLVCVHAEVNDWPAKAPERGQPEIIEWRARRLATGESFVAMVKPRQPLGPLVSDYTELPAEVLLAGVPWAEFARRWAAFLRPEDELAVWGHFRPALAAQAGLPLPATRIDVRVAAARVLGKRSGSVDQCAQRMGLRADPAGPGRCARRMALFEAVLGALLAA